MVFERRESLPSSIVVSFQLELNGYSFYAFLLQQYVLVGRYLYLDTYLVTHEIGDALQYEHFISAVSRH